MSRRKQTSMLKLDSSAYGGDLLTTRKARSRGRPVSTRDSMHLVLRSTVAKGAMSFLKPQNDTAIRKILARFASKYGVRILSLANVGNHLHVHLKLSNRFTFNPFIRAVTGAIAMAVTGRSRRSLGDHPKKFWDRRPFTRIVKSYRAFRNLKDYVQVNRLEGYGYSRQEARKLIKIDEEGARAASRSQSYISSTV